MKKIIHILPYSLYICWLIPLLAVTLAGCTEKDPEIIFSGTGPGNELTITVNVSGIQLPSTRSIDGAAGEAQVKTIDLLVFNSNGNNPEILAEHVKGTGITQSTSSSDKYQVQFKARLSENNGASTLVIVANASEQVDAAVGNVMGSEKQSILEKLIFNTNGQTADDFKWKSNGSHDYTPIPMYGEYDITKGGTHSNGITNNMKISGMELVRMLARVDVFNAASDFTLQEVYVINYQTAGYIPLAFNPVDGGILSAFPASPMVPSSSVTQTGESRAIRYDYANDYPTGLSGVIYLYESDKNSEFIPHEDAVCLVVKGTYKGADYYYRIDFTDTIDGEGHTPGTTSFTPATVDYYPVYRNHLYLFTIERVNGIGYDSFEQALHSAGMRNNLKTTLHVIDAESINILLFNNEYYFGIEETLGILPVEAGISQGIRCITNYSYGWSIDTADYPFGIEYNGTDIPWLTVTVSESLLLMWWSENTSSERTAYLHLKAGVLRYRMPITQEGAE